MKIVIAFLISLFFISCSKHTEALTRCDGYIVGFDPCTVNIDHSTGYYIISSDLRDTLLTYNLPDTLYKFPAEYFQNYLNSSYFPLSARHEFIIHINYVVTPANEKKYSLCSGDINTSEFNNAVQVIIKSATK
jgi:hypothetical protein